MHLDITHIGEALVSKMLERVAERGDLQILRCVHSGRSFGDDIDALEPIGAPRFVAERALVEASHAGVKAACDGAQRIDVLCLGRASALAMELKLGKDRLSPRTFANRFLGRCTTTAHKPPRISGTMPAVLERLLSTPFEDLHALVGDKRYPLTCHWWLVLRERVWKSWARQSTTSRLPTRAARVLLLESIVHAHGTADCFDDLVRELVGSNFAARWGVVT